MTLVWDGSFLGAYPSSILLSRNKAFRKDIAKIEWEDEEIVVSLFGKDPYLLGFYEQTRSIFFLPARRYHIIKIGSKTFIMYEVLVVDGIIKECRLSDLESQNSLRTVLRQRIQANLAWAFACGFKCVESQILIREEEVYFLSSSPGESKISNLMIKKWMEGLPLHSLIRDLLREKSPYQVQEEVNEIAAKFVDCQLQASLFYRRLHSFLT